MSFKRIPLGRLAVPLLAMAGLGVMAYTVIAGDKAYPVAEPLSPPPTTPYANTVAGAGLVEASSENIVVGTPLPGTVERVAVKAGERVAKGALLFVLDQRQAQAEVLSREAALTVAEKRVPEARALLAEAEFQFNQVRGLDDNRAVSREEVQRRETALATARARLASAEAAIAAARAELAAARTALERLTVRAPLAGEILKVNVRPGEYLAGGSAPLVLGETRLLHVRVDIDENEAWRVLNGAHARGSLKGNAAIATDLKWVRAEPLVVPKKSLTGDSSERVDTRVLQVLFSFERGQLPIYVGQQMDVFVDAKPIHAKPIDAESNGTARADRS
jgi:multidrug efflux pump subunit AcrA (membrane-fusion protein)